MSERWSDDEEPREMSRPTMDRAQEAIDRGDSEAARRLCEEMKHESQFMHDLLVDGLAGLISFVHERLGDAGVEEAWRFSLERSWRPIRGIGYPVYPSHPPDDFDRDPCVWHWYKDPADIPDEHFDRYGLDRP